MSKWRKAPVAGLISKPGADLVLNLVEAEANQPAPAFLRRYTYLQQARKKQAC